MSSLADEKKRQYETHVKQLSIQFASVAKRFIDATERRDVMEMLRLGVEAQGAMESVVKAVTKTEVAP